MKESLSLNSKDTVASFLQDGIIPAIAYKQTKDAIHTSAVRAYLESASINPILGCAPPGQPCLNCGPKSVQVHVHTSTGLRPLTMTYASHVLQLLKPDLIFFLAQASLPH
jgi:hypothetical protein